MDSAKVNGESRHPTDGRLRVHTVDGAESGSRGLHASAGGSLRRDRSMVRHDRRAFGEGLADLRVRRQYFFGSRSGDGERPTVQSRADAGRSGFAWRANVAVLTETACCEPTDHSELRTKSELRTYYELRAFLIQKCF